MTCSHFGMASRGVGTLPCLFPGISIYLISGIPVASRNPRRGPGATNLNAGGPSWAWRELGRGYAEAMGPLKDVIIALRKELEAALNVSDGPKGSTPLQAERVVLTLSVAVGETSGTNGEPALFVGVVESDVTGTLDASPGREASRTRTLCIEFKSWIASIPGSPPEAGSSAETITTTGAAEAASREIRERELVESCARILGAPGGSDSHLRAMTLIDALSDLEEAPTSNS